MQHNDDALMTSGRFMEEIKKYRRNYA